MRFFSFNNNKQHNVQKIQQLQLYVNQQQQQQQQQHQTKQKHFRM